MNKVREICLIGIFAAVNVSSRIFLQSLPNIKPVTSIIIISVMIFGLAFGVKLAIVTTIVSNLFLGMGTWTFFQILAWVIICLLTQCVVDLYHKLHKEPNVIVMSVFAFFMGYVFGFFVSLDALLVGGFSYFLVYISSGVVFDTLHACGNFVFYLICAPILIKIFTKEIQNRGI